MSSTINAESVIHRARVKWFDASMGYGFLDIEGYPKGVYVHYSDIMYDGFRTLVKGETVTCQIEIRPKGPEAVNVRRVGVAK